MRASFVDSMCQSLQVRLTDLQEQQEQARIERKKKVRDHIGGVVFIGMVCLMTSSIILPAMHAGEIPSVLGYICMSLLVAAILLLAFGNAPNSVRINALGEDIESTQLLLSEYQAKRSQATT